MRIGYLHIGPHQHGVCRYGHLLAAEARREPSLTVIEAEVILTENWEHNWEMLVKAAQQLSEAEIIHFPFHKFNELSWGGGHLHLFETSYVVGLRRFSYSLYLTHAPGVFLVHQFLLRLQMLITITFLISYLVCIKI